MNLAVLLSMAFAVSPAELAKEIREAGLDPAQTYRVRDLQFARQEARFYLNEALVSFLKPVRGRRLGAVIHAGIEGGEAEMLLIPPSRSERASLASMTKSPNLEERFTSALFLFTDATAEELLGEIAKRATPPSPEDGLLLAARWNPVLGNLSGSFEIRLVEDLLAGRQGDDGMFFAALSGQRLGNFDFVYDPRARRQITLGQLSDRDGRPRFDVWTHFQSADFRSRKRQPPEREFAIHHYRIDATIGQNLRLAATSTLRIANRRPLAVLALEISDRMDVTSILIDGQPAEVFRPASLRANLLRNDANALFLAAPQSPLAPGEHTVTARHAGEVIVDAGNNVFAVGSRVNWYPHRGTQFSTYELAFRYPKNLDLVSTGELAEERVEGDEKITIRRTPEPVRFAGFNLGDYEKVAVVRGGYRVEVFANRALETSLANRAVPAPALPAPPPAFPRRRSNTIEMVPLPMSLPPSPAEQARRLANAIAAEYEWMTERLGPAPAKTLHVSPIPGNFGQGFPGLLYLSTRSYLDLSGAGPREGQVLFSELLHAHETAHQWWGNLVTSPGYEDDWLQEALANYVALMAIESRRGMKPIDTVLSTLRDRLLEKAEGGGTIESCGPVVFGLRLQATHGFGVWRAIVYDKGTWILHMLRRRIGDQAFGSLLSGLTRRPPPGGLTTEEFRQAAVAAMNESKPEPGSYATLDPRLDAFFDTWVYGSGIPSLKLQWSVKTAGGRSIVTGSVTQTGVGDDFTDAVPIEIQAGRGRTIRRWVRTGSEPSPFTVTLPVTPTKVSLDPGWAVLRR